MPRHISHVMKNGEEKPIAFASRTLTAEGKEYALTEKQALAREFHKYKYKGRIHAGY